MPSFRQDSNPQPHDHEESALPLRYNRGHLSKSGNSSFKRRIFTIPEGKLREDPRVCREGRQRRDGRRLQR